MYSCYDEVHLRWGNGWRKRVAMEVCERSNYGAVVARATQHAIEMGEALIRRRTVRSGGTLSRGENDAVIERLVNTDTC